MTNVQCQWDVRKQSRIQRSSGGSHFKGVLVCFVSLWHHGQEIKGHRSGNLQLQMCVWVCVCVVTHILRHFRGGYYQWCFLLSLWVEPRVAGCVSKRDQMFYMHFGMTHHQYKPGAAVPGLQCSIIHQFKLLQDRDNTTTVTDMT